MFIPMPPPNIEDVFDNNQIIRGQRRSFIVPIRQPLLLISQVQRSGGTLLSQLLDGHSQLHVHHSELHIGRPNKYYWPKLDIKSSPQELFDLLCEHPARTHSIQGYSKDGVAQQSKLPFIFCTSLQQEIFSECLILYGKDSQRSILDAYITSYFNAWLDYQSLYRDPNKIRYWVAFAARVAANAAEIKGFFRDYQDGLLISIIRDPVSWYASASRYMPDRYGDVVAATDLWMESTGSAMYQFKKRPGKVLLVSFEEMLQSPLLLLKKIYKFANLRTSRKNTPTFNNIPIEANSSFIQAPAGVIVPASDRHEHVLPDVRKFIMDKCYSMYNITQKITSHSYQS